MSSTNYCACLIAFRVIWYPPPSKTSKCLYWLRKFHLILTSWKEKTIFLYLSFYKTTPIHSHNQTLKISLALGLAYWTWFLFIFAFDSITITKLSFPTPNLGFCKIGPHHFHNQTLKVIPCSRPCIFLGQIGAKFGLDLGAIPITVVVYIFY